MEKNFRPTKEQMDAQKARAEKAARDLETFGFPSLTAYWAMKERFGAQSASPEEVRDESAMLDELAASGRVQVALLDERRRQLGPQYDENLRVMSRRLAAMAMVDSRD